MRRNRGWSGGFTLLEMAMVLVVFGLLAGAFIAAGELMAGARTRGLIDDVESLRGAYFGFLDRYRAPPGDYARATSTISGATVNGNGNSLIEASNAGGSVDEPIAVWEHLARAGYIGGGYVYTQGNETNASAPRTPFGAFFRIEFGNRFAGNASARNNLNTGNLVSAAILAEADRKIDDGLAARGSFRFSTVSTAATAPTSIQCVDVGGDAWRLGAAAEANCGGTWFLN